MYYLIQGLDPDSELIRWAIFKKVGKNTYIRTQNHRGDPQKRVEMDIKTEFSTVPSLYKVSAYRKIENLVKKNFVLIT